MLPGNAQAGLHPAHASNHNRVGGSIMAKHNVLTAARLRELFYYNPETGEFSLVSPNTRWRRNKVGCVQTLENGYKRFVISIYYRHYRGSRLAWLYMTGEWPIGDVDHINGNSLDNSWKNLRDVTKSINQSNFNNRVKKNNTSGYRGVCFIRLSKPWAATYKHKRLGTFRTKEEAYAAVLLARRNDGF
jgi:hypothetical protein